jgi:hypothetical protein
VKAIIMSSLLIDRLARRLGTSGTRRQLLVTGGKRTAAGLGIAVAAHSFRTSLFNGACAFARQGAAYTRPNAHSPEANLESYALAVKNMKSLDADDPRSWSYQANVHGTLLPQSQWLDLFYTCEHHTDYFWPWHRMYLYWFEQIVRDQSGNPDFALPYWDYSDPTKQYLPEPFRNPDNALYVSRRSNDANFRDASSPSIDDPMFNYCNGLAQPSFGLFPKPGASERLESDVHDPIHAWVGGNPFIGPPGLMFQVETAAQDPVFYLHHSNLDRLWESWKSITLDGANHADPPDLPWRGTAYAFFDDTGTKLNPPWMVKDVLDTTVMDLGYVYERLADNAWVESNCAYLRPLPSPPLEAPPGTPVAALEIGSNAPEGRIEIGPEPVDVPVLVAPPGAAGTPVAISGRPAVLRLDGIAGTGAAVSVQVYINLPEGVQPNFRSPYYVGTLGLFTVQPWDANSPHAGHGATQSFDISRNITALEAAGEWTGELTVTFIPVDLDFSARTAAAGTPQAGVGTPEANPGPWATVEHVSITAG